MKVIDTLKNNVGITRGKTTSYSLELLNEIDLQNLELEDITIVPFLVDDSKTYELYEYELDINIDSSLSLEQKFLNKSGKSNINEIESNLLEIYENTIFIVNNIDEIKEIFTSYYQYLNSNLGIKDLANNLGFDINKDLYFTVY